MSADKPIQRYDFEGVNYTISDGDWVRHADALAWVDRERRKARAEAFEEAAARCFDLAQARYERDIGIPTSGEYQIGCGDCQRKALALATKERAL